jgi:endonuclease-8
VGWVHVHLGLYGAWVIAHRPEPDPRGALRLRLVGAESYADLRGPTACELITAQEKAAVHARLGPDPLRRDADPARTTARILASRTSIGALLMDQTVIAGIGNVFRAEVLFRHGVHPLRPGRAVEPETWEAMWTDLVALLRAGVRTGRIVTTRPEHRSRRRGPALQEDRFYVYRRGGQPCRVCGTTICSAELVARTVSWCLHCQPPPDPP